LLNAHAMAYHLYKNEFSSTQKGEIGITLYTEWHEPRTTKPEDIEAAKRVQEFQLGWYADPVYFGDYPSVMKKILGSKLPTFTQRQKELLKGSSDFLGINHYTSRYATNGQIEKEGWQKDTHTVSHLTDTNGKLIGKLEHPEWLYNVPWGFRKLLNHSWRRYRAPIYITENGLAEVNDPKKPLEEALKDPHRINYYKSYLTEVHNAMKEGADIRGYMAWSLMDNFEWADGYSARFGIHFVDFKNLKRYQKLSAKWWKSELLAQQ
jgi:beta-glucosidase